MDTFLKIVRRVIHDVSVYCFSTVSLSNPDEWIAVMQSILLTPNPYRMNLCQSVSLILYPMNRV